jgi:putative ABC transport system permease protein
MFKLARKSTMAHKRRLIGTALSVIIGIAFLAGTFVFTDTIKRTFDNLFANVFKNTDVYVRSNQKIEQDFGPTFRPRIPETIVAQVAGVPGVTEAEGSVQGFARIIGTNGKPIGQDNGAPNFGGTITGGQLSPWKLHDGNLPSGADQVVLDRASFKDGKFKVGDPVTIISQGGSRQFTVVGDVRFGDADSPGGATFALFDLATAQSFIGQPGQVDAVLAKGDGSVSQTELANRVRQVLGNNGTEVLTGAQITKENQSDIQDALQFFNILLLIFAAVALFVAAFTIYNTFSIIVAQRQRETALLRAVGASRRQVIGSLLAESMIIGVVASLIGFAAGVLVAGILKSGLSALGIDIPAGGVVILPRTLIVALIVGVVITVISAIMPAFRASRIPPVAAMRDVALDESGTSKVRLLWGGAIVIIGAALTGVGLTGQLVLLALGIPLVFIGVFVLGPLLARPFARFIGAPLPKVRGVQGQLARENAMRNPKRTARTAAALMVGVALVAGITVLASSIKSSVREIFNEQFTGDFVVSTNTQGFGGLPPSVAQQLNQLPEIDAAAGVQIGVGKVNGSDAQLSVFDPTVAGRVFDLQFVQGSIADLNQGTILISKGRADSKHLAVGDTLPLTLLNGKTVDLTVAGIYKKAELAGPYTVSNTLYATSGADQYDFSIFIKKKPGVSDADTERAIRTVTDAYPTAKVESRSHYIDSQAAQIDTFVNLVYGLLALAVIIAIFGIANTLSLSIYERTRELGLLRAVGASRSQVRSTVRWESVLTALLGAALGLIIGILLGYAVTLALSDQGLNSFTMPWGALVVIVVIAFLIGVVAAIGPARRAAKLDVLRAVTVE